MGKTDKYIYPRLALESHSLSRDFGFIRTGGPGLANCMFIAARAYKLSKELNLPMINPTWERFSFGFYLRREKDKRHYFGIFKHFGISGLKKIAVINSKNLYVEDNFEQFVDSANGVLRVGGLRNCFQDLDQKLSIDYFNKIILKRHFDYVDSLDLDGKIGVHIRLGDFGPQLRTDINWYKGIIEIIQQKNPGQEFLIFSDGKDEEMSSVLSLPNVKRQVGGNSIQDILSMSRCKMIIASNSTFSSWAAYLGNIPIIFPITVSLPNVYPAGSNKEFAVRDYTELNDIVFNYLNK